MIPVLCGRCINELWLGSYNVNENVGDYYHKHPSEACEQCGRVDDIPTTS